MNWNTFYNLTEWVEKQIISKLIDSLADSTAFDRIAEVIAVLFRYLCTALIFISRGRSKARFDGHKTRLIKVLDRLLLNLQEIRDAVSKNDAYGIYIKGSAWGKLRKAVFERDGYKCQYCLEVFPEGEGLQAHHLTYERLFNEDLNDLITACVQCHEKITESHHGELIDWSLIEVHAEQIRQSISIGDAELIEGLQFLIGLMPGLSTEKALEQIVMQWKNYVNNADTVNPDWTEFVADYPVPRDVPSVVTTY